MSVEVTPGGTRGGTSTLPAPLMKVINSVMFRIFRNRRFGGAQVLMLTTVGARSGVRRRSTLGWFPDGENAWLIVASANGAAKHPAWFFNLAKYPDQVWIDVGSRTLRVTPRTLKDGERAAAWQRIVAQAPSYAAYEMKTDREIPIVRLSLAA